MDRAKAERSIARRRFTLCAKKLEDLVSTSKNYNEIKVEFKKLTNIYSDLEVAQNKVLNIWLDDAERNETLFEQDVDASDEYMTQWYTLEQKYNNWIELNNFDTFSKRTCITKEINEQASSKSDHNNRRHYFLPKLELPTFNGEIKKWLAFWTQFKKIHNDDSIDKDDKFQYLLQCMEPGSVARDLIQSFPPCGDNYENAIEQLRERFANDDVIIEHYVRELLVLVLAQAKGGQKISIRSLYDKITTQIFALDSMNVTQDTYAAFLYPLVESALPEDLLKAWHRSSFRTGKQPKPLPKLLEFIKQEVESDERIRLARTGFSSEFVNPALPSTSCFTASDRKKQWSSSKDSTEYVTKACIFCEKTSHASSECVVAVNKSLEDRIAIIKQKRACGICLNTGHFWKKCWKHPKCVICQKRHFPIMCNSTRKTIATGKEGQDEQVAITQTLCPVKDKTVLLQTLKVNIVSDSSVVKIRILLDSGAQRSFIRSDVVNKLNLKPIAQQQLSHNLFGGTVIKQYLHNVYNVNICSLNKSYSCCLNVLEQGVICGYLPQLRHGEVLSRLNSLGIIVTDCTDDISDIAMLIGSDILGSLLTGRLVRVDDNLIAVETKLGWTIQGPTAGVYLSVMNINTFCCTVEDYWSLETVGIRDEAETLSRKRLESEAMQHFNRTIRTNEERRYEVRLPWKESSKTLLSNFEISLKRLNSTTARLNKLGILKDYDLIFEEWVKDGIIEEVKVDNISIGHYLPHHAVVKESSMTTKIRPVFDASSKDINGLSLNSCLDKGINLIEKIPKLLIYFRMNAIGVTADIKKAFLQISLYPEDRGYLKFLWWSNIDSTNKELKTYRHRRVVFGVTASPFLLSATILHHLDKYDTATATILKKSFYVDNCVVSVKNENDMNNFISEAKNIMSHGQFELRCWVTGPVITDAEIVNVSVLGLMWDPLHDKMFCKMPHIDKCHQTGFTKRSVLSIAQGIFDPVGFTSPVAVIPKLVIQKCWILNISWDQTLPQDLNKIMEDWVSQLHLIELCRIPRRLSKFDLDETVNTLHMFSDASQTSYACCIFLRSESPVSVCVQLILAKARVAPTKHVTMPRLELIAALMGTRLMLEVKDGLNVECKEFYWTDSSIVLAWLKRKEGMGVFVQNRVREILQHSKFDDWHHVPGNINPADLPSRGCNADKLLNSNWWTGPEWLRGSASEWPLYTDAPDENEVLKEVKKECLTNVNNVNDIEHFSDKLTYFSKYNKIVRMIAWCLRFVNRCKGQDHVGDLLALEYKQAEKCLISIIQKESNTKVNIRIATDDDGLLRVCTRLTASDDVPDFKYPILLPGKNVIVERLVAWKHVELLHVGSQTLINNIRETYWIIGIRRLAKRIVKECVTCRRYSTKACTAPQAPLPFNRINCGSPFEVTGVDLAGPLFLKSKEKCWIVLFTCAVYRGIHLEYVLSLSTEDFMKALRRFLARRGKVRVIYSDNGTNFRGTANILNGTDWQELAKRVSIQEIEWRFIPPSAPWWGGFWERMVRTVKEILRRVLGKAALQENELHTILCETEAVINSRPLTYVTDSTENLRPLTPQMFLNMNSSSNATDVMDNIDGNILTSRWRYLNTLNAHLKQRFRSEYLSLLIESCNNKSHQDLKIGDVVLIGSDDAKRVNWPLGLVLDVFTGTDGHNRVARVKTASGEVTRALQRLYRLEVSQDNPIVTKEIDSSSSRSAGCTAKVTRSGRTVKPNVLFDEYIL